MQEYFAPYRYLDESKAEGAACHFRFSGSNLGVSSEKRQFLNELATAIIDNPTEFNSLSLEERLDIIDTLTLYSNHVDQHTLADVNPKLGAEQKNMLVLRWLTAAHTLCRPFSSELLQESNIQELSTLGQTLHYYGKALRYNSAVASDDRLPILKNAETIADYLTTCNASKLLDRNGYSGRLMTYGLPVGYIYKEKKNYVSALAVFQRQCELAPNTFHQIQALVQYSSTLRERFIHDGNAENHVEMIQHAESAFQLVDELERTDGKRNMVLHFNANVARMLAYEAAEQTDTAREIATQIIEIPEGSKPDHIKSAHDVLERTSVSLAMKG